MTRYIEQNFDHTLEVLHGEPRIPVAVMARGFAGAHVAILESWLSGEIVCSAEELASMQVDLLVAGTAWSLGIDPAELGYGVSQSLGDGPRDLDPVDRYGGPPSSH
jgi:hypothetical protein